MCPYCKSPFSRVESTRRFDTVIVRRRVCCNCDGKYLTDETFGGLSRPPPGPFLPPPGAEINGNQTDLIAAIDGN